ncbi:MAG: hypothetical protein ACREVK_05580 [Gammaproteobacteria bacterium]
MTLIFITLGMLLLYIVLRSGVSNNLALIVALVLVNRLCAHRCDDCINGLF